MSLDNFRTEEQKREHYQKRWDKEYNLSCVDATLIKYVEDKSLEQIRTDCYTMLERIRGCVGVKGLLYIIEEEQKKRESDALHED